MEVLCLCFLSDESCMPFSSSGNATAMLMPPDGETWRCFRYTPSPILLPPHAPSDTTYQWDRAISLRCSGAENHWYNYKVKSVDNLQDEG